MKFREYWATDPCHLDNERAVGPVADSRCAGASGSAASRLGKRPIYTVLGVVVTAGCVSPTVDYDRNFVRATGGGSALAGAPTSSVATSSAGQTTVSRGSAGVGTMGTATGVPTAGSGNATISRASGGGTAGNSGEFTNGGVGGETALTQIGATTTMGAAPATGGSLPGLGGSAATEATTVGGAPPFTTVASGSLGGAGAPELGGAAATGGNLAIGGAAMGGTNATGGSPENGGAATGGTNATGGSPENGGAATGGVATGGVATGGVATGGVATGTGGATNSIDTTSVGPASGGAATGGAATGGAGAGGIPWSGSAFVPPAAPSCPDSTAKGCQSESCCTSIVVPGGSFAMGRSEFSGAGDYFLAGTTSEVPEHSATVTTYALDKYEVTVGRFREFVENYDVWHVSNPVAGAGRNPNANGGTGNGTGWAESWTSPTNPVELPATAQALKTILNQWTDNNWTDNFVSDEAEVYPINGVTWYLAFAFCIWDGGWLPTEAEWEYAAAGGKENRLYPWGSDAPTHLRANCKDTGYASAPNVVVGSRGTPGLGYFGHTDLAGSVAEWTFDRFTSYLTNGNPVTCDNCARVTGSSNRAVRDGSWATNIDWLRAASRSSHEPYDGYYTIGFRCARPVPE